MIVNKRIFMSLLGIFGMLIFSGSVSDEFPEKNEKERSECHSKSNTQYPYEKATHEDIRGYECKHCWEEIEQYEQKNRKLACDMQPGNLQGLVPESSWIGIFVIGIHLGWHCGQKI